MCIGSSASVAGPIFALFSRYGWRKASLFIFKDFSAAAEATVSKLEELGVESTSINFRRPLTNQRQTVANAVKSGSNVFIFFGYLPEIRKYALAAVDLGIGANYSVVSYHAGNDHDMSVEQEDVEKQVQIFFAPLTYAISCDQRLLTAQQQEVTAAMTGILNVAHATDKPPSPAFASFLDRHSQIQNQLNKQRGSKPYNRPAHPKLTVLYDAIYLYAYAVGLAVRTGVEPKDGRAMLQVLTQVRFDSLGATVSLNSNGDANVDFNLNNYVNGQVIKVGRYYQENETIAFSGKVTWFGNTSTAPPSVFKLGTSPFVVVVVVVVVAVLFFLTF